MKKLFILSLTFLSFCFKANAVKIVYPKANPSNISAASTFFIGSANPTQPLTINGEEVQTAPNGAFAKTVLLNYGTNNFVIISGDEKLNFVISRLKPKACINSTKQTLTEYPQISLSVKNDNAPLRSTPVSEGINRLAHLPLGTQILVNGEKGNFYRVYLNGRTTGWISKSDVEQTKNPPCEIELANVQKSQNKEFNNYEFDLTGKAPFSISENNGLNLKIFDIKGQPDNTYNLNVPTPKLIGYDIYYDNNKLILKIRNPLKIDHNKPLKDIKIAIDAGHGGCECGAIGGLGDKEKDINLEIAKNVQKELESRGAKIIMTRDGDYQVPLNDRVKIAKDNDAALSISIHSNALPDGQDPIKNKGTSIYYYYPQAKSLADNILGEMTTQLGTNNDKVRQRSLALTRSTASVSILIEVAYIINPDDYMLLLDKDFRKKCAKSIADGIEKYLRE